MNHSSQKRKASAAMTVKKYAPQSMSYRTLFCVAIVCGLAVGGVILFTPHPEGDGQAAPPAVSKLKLEDIPFDGRQAYEYLKQLCDIGPRPSGSEGFKTQQKLLEEHFKKFGGAVEYQHFTSAHPISGAKIEMANMLVHWNPQSERRILLCAHYDTRPYPDRDPKNPRGKFVGANDNASGVAILMQLAHDMPELKKELGVDFLLIDGEEFVFDQNGETLGDMFLGAKHFAKEYVKTKTPRYKWAILLDMVGDAELQIQPDIANLRWKDTYSLVHEVWDTAKKLGVREFSLKPMRCEQFADDHVTLHNIGGIPCIDIIDFEYPRPPEDPNEEGNPYWHTEADTPDKCSALSLAKVGWVIREWMNKK
jgi:glutaminyl-peptide cyclotransferase